VLCGGSDQPALDSPRYPDSPLAGLNRQLTVPAHPRRQPPAVTDCADHDRLLVTVSKREPSLPQQRRLFRGRAPMNYQAFTNETLTMMYEAVRGALAADDSLEGLGEEPKFKVRDTPEWKTHAADLEAEMLKRGMPFNVIDWSDEQEPQPFDK
jgi:hypothetical protein